VPISLLAVFDGHGGSAASQFCSDWLSSYIRKNNEFYPSDMALAVKSAFTRVSMSLWTKILRLLAMIVFRIAPLNRNFFVSSSPKIDMDFVSSGLLDGTTACAVTIAGKRVTCCNSGDSRAIIVRRDGSVVALSDDHKPDRNDETKRINELGGRVIYWGRWRVEGVLAVSRSIGDAKLKPYVTAEPEIVEYDLGEMITNIVRIC
jgi:serine/threonine protein phosphatase PrpC